MSNRARRLLPLVAGLFLVACEKGAGVTITQNGSANIELVNSTIGNLQLSILGQIIQDEVPFGSTANCLQLSPAQSLLTVRESTTGLVSEVPLNLASTNGTYFVIATAGRVGGLVFTLFADTVTPPAGQAAIRVVNSAALLSTLTIDVFITAPGAPLGTPVVTAVPYPNSSGLILVPAGTVQVRATDHGTTTLLADTGPIQLVAGTRTTVLVANPPLGNTMLDDTAFVATPSCNSAPSSARLRTLGTIPR